jgi:hypothetical protein
VNLQENAELIQRYLVYLRLRKEESDRNYIPTPWEKLSEEEQLLLATYHAHIHQEEDLDQQIKFRSFLRDIREKNTQLRRKRYLEKSQTFFRYLISLIKTLTNPLILIVFLIVSTFETGIIRQERSSPTPSVDTDHGSADSTSQS